MQDMKLFLICHQSIAKEYDDKDEETDTREVILSQLMNGCDCKKTLLSVSQWVTIDGLH